MSFAKFWIPCPEKTEVEADPLGTHLLSKGSLKGNKFIKTRTTNVVRKAGCARSRYTLKLSLIFFKSIN